jgi:hypothetical protein
MSTLELKGIDGGSPIGILAALGAFRVATLNDRAARMGWRTEEAIPHPFIETDLTPETFSEAVCSEACRVASTVTIYGDIIKAPAETFRKAAAPHIPENGQPGDLSDADYFAAFACDAAVEKDGSVKPTLLSFSNGGGKQFLFKDFQTLTQKCSQKTIMANILEGKTMLTECTGLNWDTNSLRSYALRWNDPNSDKKMTDAPMNILAFLGLAAVPSVPFGRTLATAGFSADGKQWIWPIWQGALSHAVVRSLLCSPPLSGILCRFASRRFTDNKRLHFAPATQV